MTHSDLRKAREIVWLLTVVWLEQGQRYLLGWTDAEVARRAAADEAEVVALRVAAFGPDPAATGPFRETAAIQLTDQRFDPTVDLELRDDLAGRLGAVSLLALQEMGDAPAGGAWDPEWSDARVADLAGVTAELVHAIHESIPWTPPEGRAEARRQRRVLLLPPDRDPLARVVRLQHLIDPRTGGAYTAEGLLDLLVATGQLHAPRTPAGRRRELSLIGLALEIGWSLVDPRGRVRTPAALARLVHADPAKVYGVIARLGPEVLAREGRPSRLTLDVVLRVEAADPRQFDRHSYFAWLITWIWQGEAPASLRTVKGWSAAGKRDIEANRDTLAARFARAVARLLEQAEALGAPGRMDDQTRNGSAS